MEARARRSRRCCTRQSRAGSRCRSGAWASPATTSTATASPRSSSPACPTTSCSSSKPVQHSRRYRDIAFKRGATAHRPYIGGDVHPSTAWHAQFADVNHDGLADLFIVKGNISSMPDFAAQDPNNLLLQRADGTFAEAGQQANIASFKRGRGGMLVDLNGDGLLDMLVVNRWDKAQLWRNVGAGTRRATEADGPLAATAPAPEPAATATRSAPGSRSISATEPRRAPGAHHRRRPRQRASGLDALRPRRSHRRQAARAVAARRVERVAERRGRCVLQRRSRGWRERVEGAVMSAPARVYD